MAAISFPSSPSNNQVHTVGTRSWKYNGTAWKLVPRTTDAVIEGSNNLYYTDARVAAAPAVTSLESRASAIESDITAIESAASSLASRVGTAEGEIDSLQGDIVSLNTRVDDVLSNVDGVALNSLAEVVAAFQAADSDLNGAISSLAGAASTNLANAVSSLEAADADLASDISGLDTRLTTAEGDIDAIESAATTLAGRVTSAEGDIDALEGRASSLESGLATAEGDIDALETGKQIKNVVAINAPSHAEGLVWIDSTDMSAYLSYGGAWVEFDKQ